MHSTGGKSVLWITGIDSQLKNLIGENCDCNNFYKEIIDGVQSHIRAEHNQGMHFYFGDGENRTVVVFSTSYKIQDMIEDIQVRGVHRIIFLRPPHNTRQSSFIATALSLGLSFISQQSPKIYPPMQQYEPLEGELPAFKLFSPKTWFTDKAKFLLEKAGEEATQILHDALVETLTNIIMGKCSFMNH